MFGYVYCSTATGVRPLQHSSLFFCLKMWNECALFFANSSHKLTVKCCTTRIFFQHLLQFVDHKTAIAFLTFRSQRMNCNWGEASVGRTAKFEVRSFRGGLKFGFEGRTKSWENSRFDFGWRTLCILSLCSKFGSSSVFGYVRRFDSV